MKIIINAVLILALWASIIYAFASFIAWDYNPKHWATIDRFLFSLMAGGIGLIIVVGYISSKTEEAGKNH